MRGKLFFGEALRSLSGNVSTTVAATMTVLIGMFLLGLFIALGSWVLAWGNTVEDDLVVKVFFIDGATPEQINAVGNDLDNLPQVAALTFVSEDEALARMEARFPELTENLTSNPLPAAFEIEPSSADDIELIAATLEPTPPGVDEVRFQEETVSRVRQVAGIIEAVFLGASAILLIASTILIANTIRLSIFSRRREIEVMKLVGASNWYVRGPFMLEGLLQGFIGAIAAVVLLFLGKQFVLPEIVPDIDTRDDVAAWSFEVIALILIGVGLLLGAAGSGITIRRFLKV